MSPHPGTKLYHAGFRDQVSRSTPADANRVHDWRIYANFTQVLIGRARELYAGESLSVTLKQTVYALDSTTFDLCLSLFPLAKFRRQKGAVKLHTLLDYAVRAASGNRENIPCFIRCRTVWIYRILTTPLRELRLEASSYCREQCDEVTDRARIEATPAYFKWNSDW